MNPITGIADCCARAATGHDTAAPPSAASKSLRPMATVILPSRARCVEGTIPRQELAVRNSAAPGAGGVTPGGGIGAAPGPRVWLDFKSAASKRKESAREVNVVFNHD